MESAPLYKPIVFTGQNPASTPVSIVTEVSITLTATTNNQTVVAAVTAERIIVTSVVLHSDNAAGQVIFLSGSGGTRKRSYWVPANTVATPNVFEGYNPHGIFRTDAGTGLFANNGSASAVYCSVTYFTVPGA